MLAISVIATVLLAISIFCRLLVIIQKHEFDLAILFDIFAIVTIWILYIN